MKDYSSAMNKRHASGFVLVCLAWLIQPAANAQSDEALLDALRDCQTVEQMSSRLACYDRILPPASGGADSDGSLSSSPPEMRDESPTESSGSTPAEDDDDSVQIVDVERPEFSTFRLTTADGRVFVHSNAIRLPQWPETPFEAEIQTNFIGTTLYLSVPDASIRARVVREN